MATTGGTFTSPGGQALSVPAGGNFFGDIVSLINQAYGPSGAIGAPLAAANAPAAAAPATPSAPTSPPAIGPAAPVAPVSPGQSAGGPSTPLPPVTPTLGQQTQFQWGGPDFWGAIANILAAPQATNVLPQLGVKAV